MATMDFEKMDSDRNITVWIGPTSNVTGVQNLAVPTAAEINGPSSGVQNASASLSWNDFDFGVQDSDTVQDPSLADSSTYEDFGQINYGGSMSLYYPNEYDDNANLHSVMYVMTKAPWTALDVIVRVDGDVQNNTAAADGDFVHVFRTLTDGEANSLQGADAIRRTVDFLSQGAMAIYTIVGAHVITAVPPASDPWEEGKSARIRGVVQDRDYTSALTFRSSDPDVIDIDPGGFYTITGDDQDTATVTISDRAAGTSTTVNVVVTA